MSEIFAEIQFVVDTKVREIMRIPNVRTRLRMLGELNEILRGFKVPTEGEPVAALTE